MRWLYKLEYKHGNRYIRNLMMIIIGGMIVAYVVALISSAAGVDFFSLISLDRAKLFQGQIWRLVTFIFIPPAYNYSIIFMVIGLYFYYIMGSSLESIWGGFRLNLYYLFGIIGAIIAALLIGGASNVYLNLSLFLAFATLAPDTTFRLFFIIPIKAKWMAIAYGVILAVQLIITFISSPILGLMALVSLAFSLINYLIFFGRDMVETIKNQIRIYKNRRNWRGR